MSFGKVIDFVKSFRRVDMGEGRVMSVLFRMSVPAVMMVLFHSMLNLADTIFISWLGEDYMAALSFGFSIQIAIWAVCEGIGNGVTALVGKRLGEGDNEAAQKTATAGLALSYMFAVLTIPLMSENICNVIFRLLGADSPEILRYAYLYHVWLPITAFFMCFNYTVNCIFRCQGDTVSPLGYFIIANGLNIVLDPIFIFTFGWGVGGAAAATFLGRVVGTVYQIVRLKSSSKIKMPFLTMPKLEMVKYWHKIVAIGLPVALNVASVALGLGTVNKILAKSYGNIAIASWMIEIRIDDIAFNCLVGIVNSLVPFLAFNYGRRDLKRMKEGIVCTFKLVSGIILFWTVLICGWPAPFIALFRPTPKTAKITAYSVRIAFLCYPATIFSCIANGLFVSIGKSVYGFIVQVSRSIVFRIAAIWWLAGRLSVHWIWVFQPIASFASMVFAVPLFIYALKQLEKELGKNELKI